MLLNQWLPVVMSGKDSDSDLQAHLVRACRDGNAEAVHRLLQSGASCNTESRDGELPLVAAASRGRLDVILLLLTAGALVDALDASHEGGTALLGACTRGHLEAVELLLAHGASDTAHMVGRWSSLDLVAAVEEELSDLRRNVETTGQQPWHPRPEAVEAVLLALRANPQLSRKSDAARLTDAPSRDTGRADVSHRLRAALKDAKEAGDLSLMEYLDELKKLRDAPQAGDSFTSGKAVTEIPTPASRHQQEVAELHDKVHELEGRLSEATASAASSAQQNAILTADLQEVTKLIDQLEDQPGLVRAHLRQNPRSPTARAAAAEAAAETPLLRTQLSILRTSLGESEAEAAQLAMAADAVSEAAQLREENALLNNQLELISEKMYGSPAKSAARERDRLRAELERERGCRQATEEAARELHAQLERAHGRVAELQAQLAAEESSRSDLERTRRALQAAQTNVALGLMGKNYAPMPAPVRHPIAAPRHQFGTPHGSTWRSGGACSARAMPTSAGGAGKTVSRSSSTPRTRGTTR